MQVPVPVQVVHNVVQVAAQPAGMRELRCPHCRKRLVTAVVKEVSLSGCSGCGGIWIDNVSARKVLAQPELVYGELAERAAENARGGAYVQNPVCAECPAVLDKTMVQGITLDICAEHGTWFDSRELQRLVLALRGVNTRGNAQPKPGMIRCTGCNRELEASRANLTADGLQCETCWRQQVDATEAAVQQSMNSSSVAATALVGVAAVLLGAVAGSQQR